MKDLEMEFYKDGLIFRWKWPNEHDYNAAKAFLENLLTYPAMEAGERDFFYFDNKEQYEELVKFRRTLQARQE